MLWKYRAVNNPIAKKRYFIYSLFITALFVIGAIYRIETGTRFGKVIILLAFCIMLVFLYTVIALGRERFYSMDEREIVYKPLKTKIKDIEDFKVDEKNMVIRLNLKRGGIFSVKTLYFDDKKDLLEAKLFLEKYLRNKHSQAAYQQNN